MRRRIVIFFICIFFLLITLPSIYGLNTEKDPLLWKNGVGSTVWSVSTSSGGRYIVAGTFDNNVYYYDSNGYSLWKYPTGGTIWSVDVSSDEIGRAHV